jgi:3-deoxy-D-manno-octulosonic-acid transferase
MADLAYVSAAHRYAARRAHRTLLILAPRHSSDSTEMVATLRAGGFSVACRTQDEQPKEATQIYVADPEDGLGLWCRLAPITYLGGSLSDGQICDPFAPATVGSAVLAGPTIVAYKSHYDRLLAADALQAVASAANLGRVVESMLATALAAQLATNAWDVTSRGADATNKLVSLIYTHLDKADS